MDREVSARHPPDSTIPQLKLHRVTLLGYIIYLVRAPTVGGRGGGQGVSGHTKHQYYFLPCQGEWKVGRYVSRERRGMGR